MLALTLATALFSLPSGTYRLPPGYVGRTDDYGDPRLGINLSFERLKGKRVVHAMIHDSRPIPGRVFDAELATRLMALNPNDKLTHRVPYGPPRQVSALGGVAYRFEYVGPNRAGSAESASACLVVPRGDRVITFKVFVSDANRARAKRLANDALAEVLAGWKWRQ